MCPVATLHGTPPRCHRPRIIPVDPIRSRLRVADARHRSLEGCTLTYRETIAFRLMIGETHREMLSFITPNTAHKATRDRVFKECSSERIRSWISHGLSAK